MKVTAQGRTALESGKTLAYASIMLDDLLVYRWFKVVQGEKEIFVTAPALNTKIGKGEDKYKNICRYTVPEFKDKVERDPLQPIVCPRLKSNIAM